MANTGKKAKSRASNVADRVQTRAAGLLDDLDEFETYRAEVLEGIRKDLRAGMTAKEIQEKYSSQLAARQVTIALTDADSAKALAAIKDLRDREEGKPLVRTEETHKFEDLKPEELDSAILAKFDKAMGKGNAKKEEKH